MRNQSLLFPICAAALIGFCIGITVERSVNRETRTFPLDDVMLIHENGYLGGAINAFNVAKSKNDNFREVKTKDSLETVNLILK